jgi:transcriptional regulator with XRE-family HTH domain
MTFKDLLRYWRKQRGLTQEALAGLIGMSGQSTIGNYESGKNQPDFDTLIKLSRALQVPVGVLIDEAEHKAFRDSAPTPAAQLKELFQLFLAADEHGRSVIGATAKAVAEKSADYHVDVTR